MNTDINMKHNRPYIFIFNKEVYITSIGIGIKHIDNLAIV